jgi:DNA-binding MarR family transcriptional regulator
MAGHVSSERSGQGWQFVTNHTQVLLCIARDPEIRLRDIADDVGITLGSAQRILADLVEAGYVKRERHGRRNRYVIDRDTPMLRHTAQDGHDIGGLLDLLRLETTTTPMPAGTERPAAERG